MSENGCIRRYRNHIGVNCQGVDVDTVDLHYERTDTVEQTRRLATEKPQSFFEA